MGKFSISNIKSIIPIKNLIGLILLSVLIVSCLFTYIDRAVETIIPEKDVTITVIQRKDGISGGNEVWITQRPGDEKWKLFNACKNGKQTGLWEYRDAQQYGYTFNAIVSYGNNAGDAIVLDSPQLPNSELFVWKSVNGGVIKISANGIDQEVDLYSDVEGGEYYSIFPFKDSKHAFLLKIILNIFLIGFVSQMVCLLYMHLYRGIKIPNQLIGDYNYKWSIVLFLIIYVYDVFQYKRGIPNFLQFGDQLFYWNSTNFFTNGNWDIGTYIDQSVSFRGYLCNFIPFLSKTLGLSLNIDPVHVFFIFTAGAGSLLLGYTMPKLYELLNGAKVKTYQILLMVVFFVFFWNGMLSAVLMDLMAVTCFLTGLMFAVWFVKVGHLHHIGLSGFLIACSILFRTSYKLGLFGLLLIFVAIMLYKTLKKFDRLIKQNSLIHFDLSLKQIIKGVVAFSVCFFIICIPQMQVNAARGHIGILPYDEKGSWSGKDFTLTELSANQSLNFGITGYPYVITDKQVLSIKTPYYDVNSTLTMNQLFDTFMSSPLDTAIYMGKKLFEGFDLKTNAPYPVASYSKETSFYLFSFLNYHIIACGIYALLKMKKSNKERLIFGLLFLTLVLPQTFVHVEWRYYIVGYLSFYYFAIYKFGSILVDKQLFRKIMSGNFLYYLCGYIYLSQWISLTFYN